MQYASVAMVSYNVICIVAQCAIGLYTNVDDFVPYLIIYHSLQVNSHLFPHFLTSILLAHSMELMEVPVALVARVVC